MREKAIQASTSHVWLGLRYTCTFNFWFWIKNREAGCYQNWAPGHGPRGCRSVGCQELWSPLEGTVGAFVLHFEPNISPVSLRKYQKELERCSEILPSEQLFISFWNINLPKPIGRHRNCTVVMVNRTGRWKSIRCDTTLPFICHGDLKPTTKPATTTRQNPSASLKSIPGSATTQNRPLQNTTDAGYTNSKTMQIITSAEQDNLILVRENLTWTEAASYCRKHHVDLVSIHSEELQSRTARKAIQASTSHVWLGLRYTCTFNFWFWIKNREAGCYQNWAPGHGPRGYEECGLSGAMESTGGHRWVGRPRDRKIQFHLPNMYWCVLTTKREETE
ncbi:uncharacterized protein LOC122360822 [Puntigrus tetrazona]|uniref:uncharacterized protein LOC122360822 n=1 Tax=Puntigrus tetrazona TaxID=1606681 RepID=UPI001C89EC8D|nr:uncharacterized protein LOC122360822 [Puntigrus tetrazona]